MPSRLAFYATALTSMTHCPGHLIPFLSILAPNHPFSAVGKNFGDMLLPARLLRLPSNRRGPKTLTSFEGCSHLIPLARSKISLNNLRLKKSIHFSHALLSPGAGVKNSDCGATGEVTYSFNYSSIRSMTATKDLTRANTFCETRVGIFYPIFHNLDISRSRSQVRVDSKMFSSRALNLAAVLRVGYDVLSSPRSALPTFDKFAWLSYHYRIQLFFGALKSGILTADPTGKPQNSTFPGLDSENCRQVPRAGRLPYSVSGADSGPVDSTAIDICFLVGNFTQTESLLPLSSLEIVDNKVQDPNTKRFWLIMQTFASPELSCQRTEYAARGLNPAKALSGKWWIPGFGNLRSWGSRRLPPIGGRKTRIRAVNASTFRVTSHSTLVRLREKE
ncbi:hypothetical protein R3P38DRAFT_2757839 [Favolaschia claudopus]|uniref:Uncharacterized protein n=1 Tax=Favolaschia claudopus TaxID=2862362 RepID=A0AAW0EAJ6_9AGAR